MNTVSDNLLIEESRRKEKGTNYQYEANVIEKQGRGESRRRNESCGRNKSKAKGHSQSCTRTTICHYCGKEGHKRSECIFLKRDQKVETAHPDSVDPKKKNCTPTTTIVVDNDFCSYWKRQLPKCRIWLLLLDC